MQIGLPEEARRHRAPRPPALADLAQLALAEPRTQAELGGDAELQTEIGRRPDVVAAERENQIDFRAPPADALQRDQRRQRLVIRGRGEPREVDTSTTSASSARGDPA